MEKPEEIGQDVWDEFKEAIKEVTEPALSLLEPVLWKFWLKGFKTGYRISLSDRRRGW